MDASRKKRVLVASLAFVMVISTAVVLFQSSQSSVSNGDNQNPGYLVGSTPAGKDINDRPVSQVTPVVNASLQTYLVSFTSIGLPQGTSWSVTVDGSNVMSTTYSTISFQLLNGTHSFQVSNPTNYMADPANGAVLVYGSPVTQYITFSLVVYEVKFVETGLPVGSSWSVNLSGHVISTSTDNIIFNVDNGSYDYTVSGPATFSAQPSNGEVLVYGNDVLLNLPFVSTLHKVTFNFGGSITGTSWQITFDGQQYTVSGNSLSVLKENGLYTYSISTGSEYWASPSAGSILVLDNEATLNVTIHEKTYTVTFEHKGVSVGTSWSVTMDGITHNSTSSVITFDVPVGNYTYDISGASGYSASSSSGYVNVASADQNVSVNFTKNPDYLTGTLLMTGGAAIGIAAGVGIGVYLIRKR